jgi:hypothetical protein
VPCGDTCLEDLTEENVPVPLCNFKIYYYSTSCGQDVSRISIKSGIETVISK